MSPSCLLISAKKPRCGFSLPLPFGRPCGAASARPVRRIASAHRAPVAGETFKRDAAARPLNPSSIYSWNRARSASGKDGTMIHPPKQDESHNHALGNPHDSVLGRDALSLSPLITKTKLDFATCGRETHGHHEINADGSRRRRRSSSKKLRIVEGYKYFCPVCGCAGRRTLTRHARENRCGLRSRCTRTVQDEGHGLEAGRLRIEPACPRGGMRKIMSAPSRGARS